jgi:hypothetical protein
LDNNTKKEPFKIWLPFLIICLITILVSFIIEFYLIKKISLFNFGNIIVYLAGLGTIVLSYFIFLRKVFLKYYEGYGKTKRILQAIAFTAPFILFIFSNDYFRHLSAKTIYINKISGIQEYKDYNYFVINKYKALKEYSSNYFITKKINNSIQVIDFFTIPITDSINTEYNVWIGLEFNTSINDGIIGKTDDIKKDIENARNKHLTGFNNYNLSSVNYFENTSFTPDYDNFLNAVSVNTKTDISSIQLILKPINKNPESIMMEKLFILIFVFVFANTGWAVVNYTMIE